MAQQYPLNFFARLRTDSRIEVAVKKSYDSPLIRKMRLYRGDALIEELSFVSRSESKSTYIYVFSYKEPIVLGKTYLLADGKNEFSPLDLTCLTHTDEFERKYRFEGELGAIYTKERTTFRLFAPLATEAYVRCGENGESEIYIMKRNENGVFEKTLEGDLDSYRYTYMVKNNGEFQVLVDPYAKSVGLQSRFGYVVNPEKLGKIPLNEEFLPEFADPTDAIIYECNVRDMTSLTDLKDKRTYKALSTAGLVDKNGEPVGIDYIASLGVSHVQLMPVMDFATIRDDAPDTSYNWGYDPLLYFVPEGSYSTNPSDPYERLFELRELVSAFHKKGIRVVLDVVYNHTFQYLDSFLNLSLPDYYYRFNAEGYLSEASGCGNDTESRRFMMRKLILDSLTFFVKYYGVDGFRFDLMGLLDIDTIRAAEKKLKAMKKDILLYGEGWNMPTAMSERERASMNNAYLLPDIAFFNDTFRNAVKGESYGDSLGKRGYLSGDANYSDLFKFGFAGSCCLYSIPPLFSSPQQSINYVECHDNETIWDKLAVCLPDEDEKTRLDRVKLMNTAVILSQGIPLLHAGQEIGQSKEGKTNTYNLGDALNGFRYDLRDKRKDMVTYLTELISIKKEYSSLRLRSAEKIDQTLDYVNLGQGAFMARFKKTEDCPSLCVIFNPGPGLVHYDLGSYYRLIFGLQGKMPPETYAQYISLPPISVLIAVGE